jgi:release factor glutamine methyltransferase
MSDTLVSCWAEMRDRLRSAGVETPAFDARLLIEAAAGVSRTDILTDPHRALNARQLEAVARYVARREQREPVSHILGKKAFWTFEVVVTPAVLTPRPETEVLVALALERIRPDAVTRIADLGTGSGAIAIALLKERPLARVVGVDRSAEALDVARFNAVAHSLADRLELLEDDWGRSLADASFDFVVSNPPYVRTDAIDLLAPEVSRYEPRPALDGGADGLDAYRALLPEIRRLLRPRGGFAIEIGRRQAEAAWARASAAGRGPLLLLRGFSRRAPATICPVSPGFFMGAVKVCPAE